MSNGISFEYYSTFAPVTGAFLADEPTSAPMNAFKTVRSLRSIDKGYYIYTNKKESSSRHSMKTQ